MSSTLKKSYLKQRCTTHHTILEIDVFDRGEIQLYVYSKYIKIRKILEMYLSLGTVLEKITFKIYEIQNELSNAAVCSYFCHFHLTIPKFFKATNFQNISGQLLLNKREKNLAKVNIQTKCVCSGK